MKYIATLNGKNFEVVLSERSEDRLTFLVDGQRYEVGLHPVFESVNTTSRPDAHRETELKPARPPQLSGSATEIVAPMPGIIVKILVKLGQQVSAGENVCVMEAMKMENNISAKQAGTVVKIPIDEGVEVQNGQLLIVLEPSAKS